MIFKVFFDSFVPWSQEQLIGLSEAKMEEEFGKNFENGDLSHLIGLSHDFLKLDHDKKNDSCSTSREQ